MPLKYNHIPKPTTGELKKASSLPDTYMVPTDMATMIAAWSAIRDFNARLGRTPEFVSRPSNNLAFGVSPDRVGWGSYNDMQTLHTCVIAFDADGTAFPGVGPSDLQFLLFKSNWAEEATRELYAAMIWAADTERHGLNPRNEGYLREHCRLFLAHLVRAGQHHGWKAPQSEFKRPNRTKP